MVTSTTNSIYNWTGERNTEAQKSSNAQDSSCIHYASIISQYMLQKDWEISVTPMSQLSGVLLREHQHNATKDSPSWIYQYIIAESLSD